MSDRETLRKALDIMERAQRSGLKADEWTTFKTARVLQDAARRFLALTETGQEAWYCDEHNAFGGSKRCEIGAQIAPDVCSIIPGRFIPADYLTEEETK